MIRDILHIYIPAFPIALARTSDPTLRNRPVAVAPSHSERAPVRHLSTEARLEGLFEGMPLFRAKRLCPLTRRGFHAATGLS
jgi:DNA polymerase-4